MSKNRRVIADWHIVQGGLVGQFRAVMCPGSPPTLLLERAGVDALEEVIWSPVRAAAAELVYTALALHLSDIVERYAREEDGDDPPEAEDLEQLSPEQLDELEEALQGGPVGDA